MRPQSHIFIKPIRHLMKRFVIFLIYSEIQTNTNSELQLQQHKPAINQQRETEIHLQHICLQQRSYAFICLSALTRSAAVILISDQTPPLLTQTPPLITENPPPPYTNLHHSAHYAFICVSTLTRAILISDQTPPLLTQTPPLITETLPPPYTNLNHSAHTIHLCLSALTRSAAVILISDQTPPLLTQTPPLITENPPPPYTNLHHSAHYAFICVNTHSCHSDLRSDPAPSDTDPAPYY